MGRNHWEDTNGDHKNRRKLWRSEKNNDKDQLTKTAIKGHKTTKDVTNDRTQLGSYISKAITGKPRFNHLEGTGEFRSLH